MEEEAALKGEGGKVKRMNLLFVELIFSPH